MNDKQPSFMPDRPLLLDGAMGRELKQRGVPIPETIWSANALLVAPDTIRQIHADYIEAGADIITTNSYGLIRKDLKKIGIEDRFAELNMLAGSLANEARQARQSQTTQNRDKPPVLIAGSLPPLRGSFRPDLVAAFEEIEPLYREQAELLAPYVDLYLCETMSSIAEARAAAEAASTVGKPVWVAWTLHEDQSGRLRSGETIAEAVTALTDLPVSGFLVNCCAPESVTAAIPQLMNIPQIAGQRIGGYANAFRPIPTDWQIDGTSESDGLLSLRTDLDPANYITYVSKWLNEGATVVGGCCGTGPEHIKMMHELLTGWKQ